ncbi:MAG: FadR/GntR family transcriptional regulator [Leucobacter sp.]
MPHESQLDQLRRAASESRAASDSVTHHLLQLLLGASMRPGDRLPSERNLTEALGVGRSAVREAIATLGVLGIVETRVGSGTYLRSTTSELLPQTLQWSMLVDHDQTADLSFVRGALERAAAGRAAELADAAGIASLQEYVAAQRDASDDVERYVDADVGFHECIAQIAQNPILSELLSTTRSLLKVWYENAVERSEDVAQATREHAEIADAIAANNVAAAQSAMERHMQTAATRITGAAHKR